MLITDNSENFEKGKLGEYYGFYVENDTVLLQSVAKYLRLTLVFA